jgi:hypothetical protein
MRPMNMKNATFKTLFLALMVGITLSLTPVAFAAAPGVAGTTFNLTAQPAYLNQPDGEAVYSWGWPDFPPRGRCGRYLSHDAGSWTHVDRHGGAEHHG